MAKVRKNRTAQMVPITVRAIVQSTGAESAIVHFSGKVPKTEERRRRSGSKIPIDMKLPMKAKNILNEENTDFSRESSVTTPSIAP